MSVLIRHRTTYEEATEEGHNVSITNECDGTTNPFTFGGDRLPADGDWVDITTLRMMKRIIDRALRDAKNPGMNEYVDEGK